MVLIDDGDDEGQLEVGPLTTPVGASRGHALGTGCHDQSV